MPKIKFKDWFLAGAFLGVVLPLLMSAITWLLGLVGQETVGVTFATYGIKENILAYVGQGNLFGGYLLSYVGNITIPGIAVSALGLGLLVYLARYIAEWLKLKNKIMLPAVFVIAGLLQGMIMNLQIPKFEILPLLFLGITAYIVSFILKAAYKNLKWKVPQ